MSKRFFFMYLYFESNMMFMKKNKENSIYPLRFGKAVSSSGMGGKEDTGFCSKGVGFQEVARLQAYTHVSNVPANERGQKFRAVRSHALNILGIIKHRIGHGWREMDHQAAWTSIGPN